MRPLHSLGLVDAQAALAAGQFSSSELVDACLRRIHDREPLVAAWAWVDSEGARRRARAYDGRRPDPSLPLAGIPVGVKDVIDTAAMPTSYGSSIYAGHQPAWSAYCVTAIERAGGIILGKTTTCEFAHSAPPPTRNPHNLGHTPGGSSSGSAAAVADFMVPAALSTQTGGSTIRPAAFCGVVGYKPSFGAINRSGTKMVAESLDTVGLMARSVGDVQVLARVLMALPAWSPVRAAPRIGLVRTPHWHEVDAECKNALLQRLHRLATHGGVVTHVPELDAPSALYQDQRNIMNYEAARSLLFEREHHDRLLSQALRSALLDGATWSDAEYHSALRRARAARNDFDALMQGFDVLITPSAPGVAPPGTAQSGSSLFNRNWSLLGVPALNLPNGKNGQGLPMGLQMVGRPGGDAELLHWAGWVESRP